MSKADDDPEKELHMERADKMKEELEKMDKEREDMPKAMENMGDKMAKMDEERSELEGKIKKEMDEAMSKADDDPEKELHMERADKMKFRIRENEKIKKKARN